MPKTNKRAAATAWTGRNCPVKVKAIPTAATELNDNDKEMYSTPTKETTTPGSGKESNVKRRGRGRPPKKVTNEQMEFTVSMGSSMLETPKSGTGKPTSISFKNDVEEPQNIVENGEVEGEVEEEEVEGEVEEEEVEEEEEDEEEEEISQTSEDDGDDTSDVNNEKKEEEEYVPSGGEEEVEEEEALVNSDYEIESASSSDEEYTIVKDGKTYSVSDDEEFDPKFVGKKPKLSAKKPKRKKVKKSNKNFVVQKILSKRIKWKKVQYLVQWKGYSSEHDTWESSENMDCKGLIKDFEKKWIALQNTKAKRSNASSPKNQTSGNRSHRGRGRPRSEPSSKKPRLDELGTGTVELVIERDPDEFDYTCIFCNEEFNVIKNKKWSLASNLYMSRGFSLSVFEGLSLFYEHFRNLDPLKGLEPIGSKVEEERQLCTECASKLRRFCSALKACVQSSSKNSMLSQIVGDLEEEKIYFKVQEKEPKEQNPPEDLNSDQVGVAGRKTERALAKANYKEQNEKEDSEQDKTTSESESE